jgi:hypothetical protein
MGTFKIKRFGNPDFLRKIQPDNLRALLLRFEGFFAKMSYPIPSAGEFTSNDLDHLATILVSPPSITPGALLDAVEMLEMLTSGNGWTELQMIAGDLVRKVKAKEDSPGDVALKVWLLDPKAIERIYTKFSIDSGRTLVCFRAAEGTPVKSPTKDICRAIAEDLSFCFSDLFNTPTSEVMMFEEQGGCAFLIRHGDMVKRLGVLNDEGKPETKAIRPLKHDVAFLIPKTLELQVSGRSEDLRNDYRRVFSKHLFGDASALTPAKRFTLEPLRKGRGCLSSPAISDINGVWLREIQLRRKLSTNMTTHRASDAFEEIEAHGDSYLNNFHLIRAKFVIRVRGKRKSLSLLVCPEEDALRGDTHDPLALAWLDACKFTTHRVLEEALAND